MNSLKVCRFSAVRCVLGTDEIQSQGAVHSVITDPDLQPLLAIVKAARNGAVYGAKVRFPHALV